MTISCNIWMPCLKLNWFFYGLSSMFQFSQFVWELSYSLWDVFNNVLLIDATDRSKISSDQKRFFIALSLDLLSFFANTPFIVSYWDKIHWDTVKPIQSWKIYVLLLRSLDLCEAKEISIYLNTIFIKVFCLLYTGQ